MSWIRLDEDFTDHPKVVKCGPLAAWLHVKAISYCNRYLTDGAIPREKARILVNWEDVEPLCIPEGMTSTQVNEKLISSLVDVGMWIDEGGSYRIHDYLEFQPSRAKVMAERDAEKVRKQRMRDKRHGRVPPGVRQVSLPGPCLSDPDPDPDPENRSPGLFEDGVVNHPGPVVAQATELLAELNAARMMNIQGARRIAPTERSIQHIAARLADGHTPDDVRHVIAVCAAEVRSNPASERWFNHETPFRPDNFARKLAMTVRAANVKPASPRPSGPQRAEPPEYPSYEEVQRQSKLADERLERERAERDRKRGGG